MSARHVIAAFFIGCTATAALFLGLYQLDHAQDREADAVETIDYLINEWTDARISVDTVLVFAQISADVRGQFRLGFIPDTVAALASHVESLYRVPKGVTLAQWVLESRFGLSDLGANNYFGHTYAALKPHVDSLSWVERREKTVIDGSIVAGRPVRFAQYRTLEQCFDAHGRYLAGSARYRSAFESSSPQEFARRLAKGGYATDPDYALKLITIMRRYHL